MNLITKSMNSILQIFTNTMYRSS